MENNPKAFRSGFVAIIGKPNVGKSTLLNRILGEKLAIVSSKPQTTRNKILGILTRDGFQAIFIDTPGIHASKTKLGANMNETAKGATADADAALIMAQAADKPEQAVNLLANLNLGGTPAFLVINKIDTIPKREALPLIEAYSKTGLFREIVPVSALTGENVDTLLDTVLKYLPEGPKYYPEDMLTDRPERFIASEMIREKALRLLRDEIPHGLAVEITSMKPRNKRLMDIEATIFCEKDSHKAIVIGAKGAALKDIGTRARVELERFTGQSVNLNLWVKVKRGWRDSDFYIKEFGYKPEV